MTLADGIVDGTDAFLAGPSESEAEAERQAAEEQEQEFMMKRGKK